MPNYFQFLTLLAFDVFVSQQVDVAILEVGLGGRLDATNVVTPVVCGISTLDYDHCHILGYTIAEIAAEVGCSIKEWGGGELQNIFSIPFYFLSLSMGVIIDEYISCLILVQKSPIS